MGSSDELAPSACQRLHLLGRRSAAEAAAYGQPAALCAAAELGIHALAYQHDLRAGVVVARPV
jgi:hypothetical protein